MRVRSPIRPVGLRRGVRRLGAWTLALLAALVLVEFGLHVAAWALPSVRRVLDSPERASAVPDSALIWRPSPEFPGHDDRGFRNRTALDSADVVVLGDSQTYGVGVNPEQAWPQVLERSSGHSVYGMAFGGYGPVHYARLWSEALELGPRVVLVALYLGNDLFDAFDLGYTRQRAGASPDLSPAARAEIEEREQMEPLGDRVARLRGGRSRAWIAEPKRVLATHSRIYGATRAIRLALESRRPFGDGNGTALAVRLGLYDPDRTTSFDDGRFRTTFSVGYRYCGLDDSDPRIREGLRLTSATIDSLHRMSEACGVELGIVLLPTKELVFADLMRGSAAGVPREYEDLIGSEERARAELERCFRSRGIPCIDALAGMKRCFQRGLQPYDAGLYSHPNPVGHAAIAEAVRASEIVRDLSRATGP